MATTLPPLLKRNEGSAGATPPVRVDMKKMLFAARFAYSWKKKGIRKDTGPDPETLRQEAVERAKLKMKKEHTVISKKLTCLSCKVNNMRRETNIDAEYVRIKIQELTKRAIQEIYAREKELLQQVTDLVTEAHTTLDGQNKQLSNLKTQFQQKKDLCSDKLEKEIQAEGSGTPPSLMVFQEEIQQTLNLLKTNEALYKKRWVGFRAANEPNFRNTVKVLGFVGIDDTRSLRPWRHFGAEGVELGQFRGPVGIDIIQKSGHVAVSDFENHRVQVLDRNEQVVGVFGRKGSGNGCMKGPNDVKIDSEGRYVVADTFNHRVCWFDKDMEFAHSIGRKGNCTGEFDRPRSLAITAEGNIVVADTGNQRVQVFSCDGEYLFSFGDLGKGPGQFKGPHGLAVDEDNNIFVADLYNHRIQVFDNEGHFIRSFGTEGKLEGELSEPRAIGFTPSMAHGENGNLVIAEMENQRVSVFSSDGQFLCSYGDTLQENSMFGCPSGVTVDRQGRIFISDSKLNVVHIL